MLRVLRGITSVLWAAPPKKIEIQVAQDGRLSDINDSCRGELIKSFSISSDDNENSLHAAKFQIAFDLNPCDNIELKFCRDHIVLDKLHNKIETMAKCAAQIIFEKLMAVCSVDASNVKFVTYMNDVTSVQTLVSPYSAPEKHNGQVEAVQLDIENLKMCMMLTTGPSTHTLVVTHLMEQYEMEKQTQLLSVVVR